MLGLVFGHDQKVAIKNFINTQGGNTCGNTEMGLECQQLADLIQALMKKYAPNPISNSKINLTEVELKDVVAKDGMGRTVSLKDSQDNNPQLPDQTMPAQEDPAQTTEQLIQESPDQPQLQDQQPQTLPQQMPQQMPQQAPAQTGGYIHQKMFNVNDGLPRGLQPGQLHTESYRRF